MGIQQEDASTLYAGELEVRLSDGLVLADGRALTLSMREFELLVAMVRNLGTILTRSELYGIVWGGELRPGDRSVDVYVSKLRSNLETAMPDHRFIHTHPGFGYRFQPQPAGQPVGSTSTRTVRQQARQSVGRTGQPMGQPATAQPVAQPAALSQDIHNGHRPD